MAFDKSPCRIQKIVDNAPPSSKYCTSGYFGYLDVIYPGGHIRNTPNKSDTFTVEGINTDLRHYIPVLARLSRYFCRKLETLHAIVRVFLYAYNQFGRAKHEYLQSHKAKKVPFAIVDFI